MLRRRIGLSVFALVLSVLAAGAVWHYGDVEVVTYWRFEYDGELLTDTDWKIYAYNAVLVDTAGVGYELTMLADTTWECNAPTAPLIFWGYSDSLDLQLNPKAVLAMGATVPPAAIDEDSSYAFKTITGDSAAIAHLTASSTFAAPAGSITPSMMLQTPGTAYTLPRVNTDSLMAVDTLDANVANVDSLHIQSHLDAKAGAILQVGTTRWDGLSDDKVNVDALPDEVTLATEMDDWREMPTLLAGKFPVGGGTNLPAARSMSGDATMDSLGAVAVADDSHAHTGSTLSSIDISSDTNLAGDTEIVLTGDALSIAAEIARDTEQDTWAEHPVLTSGYTLQGNGSNQPAAASFASFFPFAIDTSMYGTIELGENAADTLYTAWKSGATTGDLVICGFVDYPLHSTIAGGANLQGRVTASKKVQLYRWPVQNLTMGGHTVWYIVLARP